MRCHWSILFRCMRVSLHEQTRSLYTPSCTTTTTSVAILAQELMAMVVVSSCVGCRAVPVVNAQFDGAGEGGLSVNGCHCPGSSVLLEQGSFSFRWCGARIRLYWSMLTLSCVVWWSALVGHCPFGCLAQWWLIPGFQLFFVSCVLVAMLDAAAKMVSMICVLCFRVLQRFRGNVKDKESGTWAVMWTNSLYSTIHQAMDGCGDPGGSCSCVCARHPHDSCMLLDCSCVCPRDHICV